MTIIALTSNKSEFSPFLVPQIRHGAGLSAATSRDTFRRSVARRLARDHQHHDSDDVDGMQGVTVCSAQR